jgi:hypothetical protein
MDQAWYSQVSGICSGGSATVLAHLGRRHSAARSHQTSCGQLKHRGKALHHYGR